MKARKHRADSTRVEPFWRFRRLADIGAVILTALLLDRRDRDTGYVSDARNQRELKQGAEGNGGRYLDVGLGGVAPGAGGWAIDTRASHGTSAKLGRHGSDTRIT